MVHLCQNGTLLTLLKVHLSFSLSKIYFSFMKLTLRQALTFGKNVEFRDIFQQLMPAAYYSVNSACVHKGVYTLIFVPMSHIECIG